MRQTVNVSYFWSMGEADRKQRSRQFGVKLAKLLKARAAEAAQTTDPLDPRHVMLGAADYLRDEAAFQIDPPIDATRTDPDDRRN